MSNVKSVHWAARMPNSDKLCNSFRTAGADGRLDFSLSLLAARGSVTCPCIMWSGSKELQLAKKNVKAQLAGCLRELEGCLLEWDVGMQ